MIRISNVSISLLLIVSLVLGSSVNPAAGQALSAVSAVANASISTVPAINLQGLKLDPLNPLNLDFLIYHDDQQMDSEIVRKDAQMLIKYFLAAVTIPDDDLWVNLSPNEPDRIIPEAFARTDMGRDFLKQDYELKQFTASLLSPDSEMGRHFWDKIYAQAAEQGITDIPIETFNKVWIVPGHAEIYENNGNVIITESTLKVMTESDYLSRSQNNLSLRGADGDAAIFNKDEIASQKTLAITQNLIRESIIPVIEKEVNTGERFAPLRRMFHAMILAVWFNNRLQDTAFYRAYAGRNKMDGIETNDEKIKETIYAQYLQAFRSGSEGLIREAYDPSQQDVVIRQYFSGGLNFRSGVMVQQASNKAMLNLFQQRAGHLSVVHANLAPTSIRKLLQQSLNLFFKKMKIMMNEKDSLEESIIRLKEILSKGGENGVKYLDEYDIGRPDLVSLKIVGLTTEALKEGTFGNRLRSILQKKEFSFIREMVFSYPDTSKGEYVFRLSTSTDQIRYRQELNERFLKIVNVSHSSLRHGIQDNIPRSVVKTLIIQLRSFEDSLVNDHPEGMEEADVQSIRKEFRMLMEMMRGDIRAYIQKRKDTIEGWREGFKSFAKEGRKEFYLFDLHGETSPVRRALREIRWRLILGKPTRFIFHGDAFDRGYGTVAIFKMFRMLDKLLGDNFIFILGNHDVLMIEALVTESDIDVQIKNMIRWMNNGGDTVLEELGMPRKAIQDMKDKIKIYENSPDKDTLVLQELLTQWKNFPAYGRATTIAFWMLKKGRFFYSNPKTGWMHTHAGIAIKGDEVTVDYEILQKKQNEFLQIQSNVQLPGDMTADRKYLMTHIFHVLRDAYWLSHWTDAISQEDKSIDERERELRRYVTKVVDRIDPGMGRDERRSRIEKIARHFKKREGMSLKTYIWDWKKFDDLRDMFNGFTGIFFGHNHYSQPFIFDRIVGADVDHKVHMTLDADGLKGRDTRLVSRNIFSRMLMLMALAYSGVELLTFYVGQVVFSPILMFRSVREFFEVKKAGINATIKYQGYKVSGFPFEVFSRLQFLDFYRKDWDVWDHLNQELDGRRDIPVYDDSESEYSLGADRPDNVSFVNDIFELRNAGVHEIKFSDSLANEHIFEVKSIPANGFSVIRSKNNGWDVVLGVERQRQHVQEEIARVMVRKGQLMISVFDSNVNVKPVYPGFKEYKGQIEIMLRGFHNDKLIRMLSRMYLFLEKRVNVSSDQTKTGWLGKLVERLRLAYEMDLPQKRQLLQLISDRWPNLAPKTMQQWLKWLDDLSWLAQYPLLRAGQTILMTGQDRQQFSFKPDSQVVIKAAGEKYYLRVRRSGQAEMRRAGSEIAQVQPGPTGTFEINEHTIRVDFDHFDITVVYKPSSQDIKFSGTVEISVEDRNQTAVEKSSIVIAGEQQATNFLNESLKSGRESPVSLVVGSGFGNKNSLDSLRELALRMIKDISAATGLDADAEVMNNFSDLNQLSYVQMVELIERLNREFSPFFGYFMQPLLESMTSETENYLQVAHLMKEGFVRSVIDTTPGSQVRRAMESLDIIRIRRMDESGERFRIAKSPRWIRFDSLENGLWEGKKLFFWNEHNRVTTVQELEILARHGIPVVHEFSPLASVYSDRHIDIFKYLLRTSQVSVLGVESQNSHFMNAMKEALQQQTLSPDLEHPLRLMFHLQDQKTYNAMMPWVSELPFGQQDRVLITASSTVRSFLFNALKDFLFFDFSRIRPHEFPINFSKKIKQLNQNHSSLERYVMFRILLDMDPSRMKESNMTGKSQEQLFVEWNERLDRYHKEKKILNWQYYDLKARLKRNQMDLSGAVQYYELLSRELLSMMAHNHEQTYDFKTKSGQEAFINDWRLNKRLINASRETAYFIKMSGVLKEQSLQDYVRQAADNNVSFAKLYYQNLLLLKDKKDIADRVRTESSRILGEIHALFLPVVLLDLDDQSGHDRISQMRILNRMVLFIAELVEARDLEPAARYITKAEGIIDRFEFLPDYRIVRYLHILRARYYYYKGRIGDEEAYREILWMARRNHYAFLHQLKVQHKQWWLVMSEIFVQALWWEAGYDLSARDVSQEYQFVLDEALSWFDEEARKENPQFSREELRAVFYLLSSKMNERYVRQDLPNYEESLLSRMTVLEKMFKLKSSPDEQGSRLRNQKVVSAYQRHLRAVSLVNISWDDRLKAYEEAIEAYQDAIKVGLSENVRRESSRQYQIRPMIHLLQLHIDMILFLRQQRLLSQEAGLYRKVLTNAVEAQRVLKSHIDVRKLNPILSREIERFDKILHIFQSEFMWFDNGRELWNASRDEVLSLVNQIGAVSDIRRILDESSIVFVEGAPGSGKMIQTQLALQGKGFVMIDIRKEFFQYYERTHPQMNWEYFKELYQSDIGMRRQETQWMIKEGLKAISEKINLAPRDATIIFEHFALSIGNVLEGAELKNAQRVVSLFRGIKMSGQKAVFMVDDESLGTIEQPSVFAKWISGSGVIKKEKTLKDVLVRTGYFSRNTERLILKLLKMSSSEKVMFMKQAQGLPVAYMDVLKSLADWLSGRSGGEIYPASMGSFKKKAQQRAWRNYLKILGNVSPRVIAMVRHVTGVSNQNLSNSDANVIQKMVDSGLVGRQDGKVVVSKFVQKVVQQETKSQDLFDNNGISLKEDVVSTLSRRELKLGKKPAFVLDIHGLMLESSWRQEYALAYALIKAEKTTVEWKSLSEDQKKQLNQEIDSLVQEGLSWIDEYFVKHLENTTSREAPKERLFMKYVQDKDNKTFELGVVQKGFKTARDIFKLDPDRYAKATQFIQILKDLIEDKEKQYGIEIPILVLSGTETEYDEKQLEKAGLKTFFVNPERNKLLVGSDLQKEYFVSDKKFGPRGQILQAFRDLFPDHLWISFDDWDKIYPDVLAAGGYNMAFPQGNGEMFDRNAAHLMSRGADFVVNQNQSGSIAMCLRIVETAIDRYVERLAKERILSLEAMIDQGMLGNGYSEERVVFQEDANKGGIDFSTRHWTLESRGDSRYVDISGNSYNNVIGFEPVIVDVAPVLGAESFFQVSQSYNDQNRRVSGDG